MITLKNRTCALACVVNRVNVCVYKSINVILVLTYTIAHIYAMLKRADEVQQLVYVSRMGIIILRNEILKGYTMAS